MLLLHRTENVQRGRSKVAHFQSALNIAHFVIQQIPDRLDGVHPDPQSLGQSLYQRLLRPLCNVLVSMDPTKRSAVHQILNQYAASSTSFGFLYGAPSLDDSYHFLMADYTASFDQTQSASKNAKNGKSIKSPKPMSPNGVKRTLADSVSIESTPNAVQSPFGSDQSPGIETEFILKHYISNYAVPPPLGDDASNRMATRNESFCLLEGNETVTGNGIFCDYLKSPNFCRFKAP